MTYLFPLVHFINLVSIHTPTKGVTFIPLVIKHHQTVSIHTPTKGVTILAIKLVLNICVSIHTPTKGVTAASITCYRILNVSIHTPTKGVTIGYMKKIQVKISFNPHTHEGCDCFKVKTCCNKSLFQSTHPRRV